MQQHLSGPTSFNTNISKIFPPEIRARRDYPCQETTGGAFGGKNVPKSGKSPKGGAHWALEPREVILKPQI